MYIRKQVRRDTFGIVSFGQGTAASEAGEFSEVYGLEVVRVPTNRPSARRDLGAYMFADTASKHAQLVYLVRF